MKSLFIITFLFIQNAWCDHPLSISGTQCEGHELVQDYQCLPNEWLISFHKRCQDGYCDESASTSFIAKLFAISDDHFSIRSRMPVSAETRWVLRQYGVKKDLAERWEIYKK
jgi:hypothetical protein